MDTGEINASQAQQLRDFNEANPSARATRNVDSVLDDINNPDLEFNPGSGRFRNKNGSGGIEVDDATRQRAESGRIREGRNQTPEADTPEHQRLAEQRDVVDQRIRDAETEIENLSSGTSPEALDYQRRKGESFENRHPEAEHRSRFNEEYDSINGGDTSDPNYIREREEAFIADRRDVRQDHSARYDRGQANNRRGDAFEDARVAQRNAELEQQLGRPLREGEGFTRRTPADKIEFEIDGQTVRVSPDLEHPGGFIESKSGRLSLTPEVEDQMIRYAQLARHTGKQITYELLDGASESVLRAFRRYGIDYIDFSRLP